YYDLVARKQSYIASRWQEDVPTYSVIDMTEDSFTINTYRTDTDEKIDTTFTIKKTNMPGTSEEVPPNAKKVDIKKVKITGAKDVVYTGKVIKQKITIKDPSGTILKEGRDYKISYKNNKNTGIASIAITGIGNYEGSRIVTFQIQPPKVSWKKLSTAGSEKIRVRFAAVKGSVTGYQITYAQNSSFKSAQNVTTKKTDYVLKKLKIGKSYFVKIRAYKQVGKQKIYGKYSAKKEIKVK
ncbi:MAG: fibronectin type III domain-containing protein, partial [Lachnospiraceae bacterium]|nr:fibronectin type III domain-containing protein [Lachnospiraceae bacterium]